MTGNGGAPGQDDRPGAGAPRDRGTTRTFTLPDLGEGLTEAEVVRWLVAEGDDVTVDQAVAEVETAKSLVEVPTPYAGVVTRLCAAEGDTLEVGLPLLEVGERDGAPVARADDAALPTAGADAAGRAMHTGGDAPAADPADGSTPVWADDARPAVRAGGDEVSAVGAGGDAAHEVPGPAAAGGAELTGAPQVASSSLDEAYREEERAGSGNVLVGFGTQGGGASGPRRRRRPRKPEELAHPPRAAVPPEAAAAPPAETRVAMSGFQRAAAAAMSRSRAEIPEATIWVDVDFTALCELRATHHEGPGLLAYLARFVVAALADHPVLNARVDTERQEIVQLGTVNLGLAVQGERGLIAPAVLGAERMTTARLDAAIRDVVARAREGRTTAEELTAGTFTLNNYGGLGVDGSAPIINHPQVAMLGVGRVIDRPWVVDGQVTPRRIAQVSFVFDHRVCDGVEAAAFLRAVTGAVEDPSSAIGSL
ncbi:dihydrolipoamide acetyltransferase family protein [Myceligenerans crystallogenes]|uniref:Dihydrolipoamide acetyltransferase component of pyruvate dehydrogenase complex n=1 Tax=Myceligenerans crystallogenes TaxID=316335 RepID=A0ABN2N5K1_9MICO